MDPAIHTLEPVQREDIKSVCTDGRKAYYSPAFILREYKRSPDSAARYLLHMLLHCIFRHYYTGADTDRELWDTACDIAVENMISELGLYPGSMPSDGLCLSAVRDLKGKVKYMTAEHIYRYLRDTDDDTEALSEIFRRDDHSVWYSGGKGDISGEETAEGGIGDKNGTEENSAGDDDGDSSGESSAGGDTDTAKPRTSKSTEEIWQDISRKMQMDLESFSKRYGDQSGSLVQNLIGINREKYDYSSFLRKFAVYGEAMKINDDEFDNIFYTYGLSLYGNMPLIEPLEYKEVRRIKEFVIAIDTSGSVSGDLVRHFVKKTYSLLRQEESFFAKINLHIIQCDALIREKAKITSQEELDRYIRTMKLKGFMGTDFRPVFDHIDELIDKKEFTDLRGLIYFTDGYGIFPDKIPKYKTAFIFVDDGYNDIRVPPWAIKLVLRPEEI